MSRSGPDDIRLLRAAGTEGKLEARRGPEEGGDGSNLENGGVRDLRGAMHLQGGGKKGVGGRSCQDERIENKSETGKINET